MKNHLFSFTLVLLLSSGVLTNANAQATIPKICFIDDEGQRLAFNDIHRTGNHTYYAEGVFRGYPQGKTAMWLDVSRGFDFGVIEIHVINGKPDNCNVWSDSFILRGVIDVLKCQRNQIFYTGGIWTSYCFGDPLFHGTWSGVGPCHLVSGIELKRNTSPTKGSGNQQSVADAFSMKVAPNPVKSYSQLDYKLTSPGRVNITVYNYLQQPVKVLVNEYKGAGSYSTSWNALNSSGAKVPSGIYKVVATIGGKIYSQNIQVMQ